MNVSNLLNTHYIFFPINSCRSKERKPWGRFKGMRSTGIGHVWFVQLFMENWKTALWKLHMNELFSHVTLWWFIYMDTWFIYFHMNVTCDYTFFFLYSLWNDFCQMIHLFFRHVIITHNSITFRWFFYDLFALMWLLDIIRSFWYFIIHVRNDSLWFVFHLCSCVIFTNHVFMILFTLKYFMNHV